MRIKTQPTVWSENTQHNLNLRSILWLYQWLASFRKCNRWIVLAGRVVGCGIRAHVNMLSRYEDTTGRWSDWLGMCRVVTTLSQEANTNSPNISYQESLCRTSSIQALSRLYPIYIGSFYRLLLSRDNVKYHGSTRWSIIFSPLINYTECQTITGVLWDSIGLYLDCKSSFLLRKTKIIYNLPTITLEAAYHDVLYLISFFYHQ